MMKYLLFPFWLCLLSLSLTLTPQPIKAAQTPQAEFLPYQWSFEGIFGVYDRGQLRRGYQVYREVCATCHSMKYLYFRNLGEKGGLEYSAEQVKAIAASFEIDDGPDREGNMFKRAGRPSDHFPPSYENDVIATIANGGAMPPDLSLIAKARLGGAHYIYSFLQGYSAPPIGFEVALGQYYNRYKGDVVAMAPPLVSEQVAYQDGRKATVAQMSADVAAFLTWAADPHMEARKRIGFQVLIYLALLSFLLFLTQRRIWRVVKDNQK